MFQLSSYIPQTRYNHCVRLELPFLPTNSVQYEIKEAELPRFPSPNVYLPSQTNLGTVLWSNSQYGPCKCGNTELHPFQSHATLISVENSSKAVNVSETNPNLSTLTNFSELPFWEADIPPPEEVCNTSWVERQEYRLFITAEVAGVQGKLMVDTGATATFISKRYMKTLQNMGCVISPSSTQVGVADGACIEAMGEATLTIVVGPAKWTGLVYFFSDFEYLGLLGLDAIRAMRLNIQPWANSISIDPSYDAPVLLCPVEIEKGVFFGQNYPPEFNAAADEFEFDEEDVLPGDLAFSEAEPVVCDHPAVTSEQAEVFNKFLSNWKQKFASVTGKYEGAEFNLFVDPQQPPIRQRPYPLTSDREAQARVLIQELLDEDIIERSNSEWISPAFVIPKKTAGDYRLVCDFRRLNLVTKRIYWPMAQLDQCLNYFVESRYISCIDLRSGYLQIPVAKEAQKYLTFAVHGCGVFSFKRMPFGVANAPAYFQSVMDDVLRPLLEAQRIRCYIDDIAISSVTFKDHVATLDEVFSLLHKANLKIHFGKSKFLQQYTAFLGHKVGNGELHVCPIKSAAVRDFPRPTTLKKLRGFLSLLSWFRRFIPNLSERAAPLYEMTQKNIAFIWTDARIEAYESLRLSLSTPPVLHLPDLRYPYHLYTDASDIGMSCMALQEINGEQRVVGFWSKVFTKTQRNYTVLEREFLAVLSALEHFKLYILGRQTTFVHCDHASLKWVHNLACPSGRLARWVTRLAVFDVKIVHVPGKLNLVADAMSRAPVQALAVTLGPKTDFSISTDEWYQRLRSRVMEHPFRYPIFRVENNHLLKLTKDPVTKVVSLRHVVPSDFREDILSKFHGPPSSGHCGAQKTFHKIAAHFYWPKMREQVRNFVRKCKLCQKCKASNTSPYGLMVPKEAKTTPFLSLACDLLGPVPMTRNRNRFILIIVDYASKFVIARPLKTATSKTVIAALKEHVCLAQGSPQYLLSDNGSQFVSAEFKEFCAEYAIKSVLIPKYFAAANPAERYVGILKNQLRIYCHDNQTFWDEYLPAVVFAINTSVSDITGYTPFKLTTGREARSCFEIAAPSLSGNTEPFDPATYVGELDNELDAIWQRVKVVANKMKLQQARQYNQNRKPWKLTPGELVWRLNHTLSSGAERRTKSLEPKFCGPFRVLKVLSDSQIQLETLSGVPTGLWAVSQLKPYVE